ncbi:aldehyde dehydrogenase family protein [Amycolatopsis acidicola]|uniref:Aldehyde dehydrogenase family protein n=2 Tax=Amycolatopsis acidicola TaxID=2596893 RepID=A0A5N0VF94_9PSEU|nr:aldehyde dehydrogenase family protein [Amycolatopsis acidicola]
MDVVRERTFGPVVSVLTFSTEQETIALADSTDGGLAASVAATRARGVRPVHRNQDDLVLAGQGRAVIIAGRLSGKRRRTDGRAPPCRRYR